MLDLLELNPLVRPGMKLGGGSSKSERHFLDFVVNGHSLWEKVGKAHDMVSVLCREFLLDQTKSAVNRLLRLERADMPDDRRSLFICSECGDLGCGAITAIVSKKGETVVWSNFGYQNNYEENVISSGYDGAGPFTFDAVTYECLLLDAVNRLGAS